MNEPIFLFCCDYFGHQRPDPDYAAEYDAVLRAGQQVLLFDLTEFLATGLVKLRAAPAETLVIYRGWMISVQQYESFYQALVKKNYHLINQPQQYRQCHYLPFWYDQIAMFTPKSIWSGEHIDQTIILSMLEPFRNQAVIVKDYVKSRKHEWDESFFIPCASDSRSALKVINHFLIGQGEELLGGLVIRAYCPLKMLGRHPQSRMPLAKEVRVFCYRHQPFCYLDYWSGEAEDDRQCLMEVIQACEILDSNFYTIDLAQTATGQWIIIEVGDGQVSGLQDFSAEIFYNALFEVMQGNTIVCDFEKEGGA